MHALQELAMLGFWNSMNDARKPPACQRDFLLGYFQEQFEIAAA
jgi:hypothetical protein